MERKFSCVKNVFYYQNSISVQIFFSENGKIMPELFQILKYARFYAKEQFFMKIMLKT